MICVLSFIKLKYEQVGTFISEECVHTGTLGLDLVPIKVRKSLSIDFKWELDTQNTLIFDRKASFQTS